MNHQQAQENRRQRRDQLWNKIQGRLIFQSNVFLFFSCLFVICKLCARQGEREKNRYTLNHLHYNLHVFSIIVRSCLVFILCTGSQGNFDIDSGYRICDSIVKTFLFLVRLACLLYFFLIIIPDFGHLLKETSELQNKNWWQSDDEPFLTNVSSFNAIVCWALYIFFCFFLYFVLYMYLPVIFVVNFFALMREPPATRRAIRLHCCRRVLPSLG